MTTQLSLPHTPAPRRPRALMDALPLDQQLAYRINTLGANACSIVELLAAIIGGPRQLDQASELLKTFGGNLRNMAIAPMLDYMQIPGIGETTAARIKAALCLASRTLNDEIVKTTINSPSDAAAIFLPVLSLLTVEQLHIMSLDTRNQILETRMVVSGSVNASQVRIGDLFTLAMQAHAAAIIVAHNHPSADPTPSPDDVSITRAIVQAGKLLEIDLLDHIIIGGSRWISLKER